MEMEEKRKPSKFNNLNNYFSVESSPSQKRRVLVSKDKTLKQTIQTSRMNNKIASLMIKVNLSKDFDMKQFKLISSVQPDEWIRNQKQLLNQLFENNKLYQKYFPLFNKNQTTLLTWYQLAAKQKSTISPYVFKQFLIQKKNENNVQQGFNNERLKQSIYKKKSLQLFQGVNLGMKLQSRNSNLSNQGGLNDSFLYNQSQNVSFMKPSLPMGFRRSQKKPHKGISSSLNKQKQQLMGVFFNNMIEINTLEHKRKPINLKLYELKKKDDMDSHELYLKTFDACNGRKYIFYDYQKHMKGLNERNKYNQFLRKGEMDNQIQNFVSKDQHQDTKKMTRFVQFDQQRLFQSQKQKCSLLPINTVLNQKQLNNYRGLKKVITKNKSSKIVFVNHQGKPITYYIKQQSKQGQNNQSTIVKSQNNKQSHRGNTNLTNSVTVR